MRIVFLSTSRLPTEKAYGVTITESAKAAREQGIDFKLFAPSSDSSENLKDLYSLSALKSPKILSSRNAIFLRKVIFRLNSMLIPILCLKSREFRNSHYIWLRDPISALMLSTIAPKKKILLEIHHRPVGLSKILLRILNRFSNLSFSGISQQLISDIEHDVAGIKIFEAPMGVPESFFSNRKLNFNEKPTRLVYIGKGQSSGFDNGIETLIRDFARALAKYPQLRLTLLGLERVYRSSFVELGHELSIPENNLIFMDHIKHEEVPHILSIHDVGLLPYPSSRYNNERFPIKSLEYAAAGLIMVASNIDAHLALIGKEKSFIYAPGEFNSFELAIGELMNNYELSANKALNAKEWAAGYTYKKRIQRVVQEWLGEFL